MQQSQVRSQPLKLLLLFIPEHLMLVTLSIAVLRGVVFGAPLGLIVAATALLAVLLLPPLGTALLHLLGAVTLDVPLPFACLVLDATAIAAPRPENTGPDALRNRWSM